MRRIPSQLAVLATAFACMLALVACGSSAPVLQYVTISPVSGVAQAIAGTCGGDPFNFTASAYYSDGSIKDGTSLVTWGSSNTAVATIASGGVATAVGPGTTTITASAAGTPGASSNLTVTAASSSTLAISPGPASVLPLGTAKNPTTLQYMLTGTFGSGGTEDLTTAATWASSDMTKATIGANTGLATSIAAGTTNISATIYCVTVPPTATPNVLTVIPPAPIALNIITPSQAIPVASSNLPTAITLPVGGTQQFAVQEVWSDGSTPTASSNPTLAFTVSPSTAPIPASITSSGYATALLAGSATSTVDATETIMSGTVSYTIGSSSATYPLGTSGTITVAAALARFAYVANGIDSSISEYAVNGSMGTPSGVLSPLGKFSEPNGPQQVILHPSGAFLYSLGSDSAQTVTLFDVDPTAGGLTATSNTYATSPSTGAASTAAMDAGGNYLYVSNSGSNTITAFSVNQVDGTLTALSPMGTNLNTPTFILVDNSGPYLYATNSGNATISGYTINTAANTPASGPAGTLAPIATNGTLQLTSTDVFAYAAIDPTGGFIYVPDYGGGKVEVATIGKGGALGTLTGTPFPVAGAGKTVSAVVDPTATFLYVLDASTTSPAVYTLPLTAGAPGAVASHVPTGPSPVWIAEDVTGSLLSVVNSGNNTLSNFTIGKGGVLTDSGFNPETAASSQSVAFYTGTAEPTVAPTEVVAANAGSGNVAAFTAGTGGVLTIDPTTGHYTTFVNDDSVVTNSLSSLVLTFADGGAQLAAYTANAANASASPATPTLTAVAGSPFTIGTASLQRNAVSFDATGTFIFAADTVGGVVAGFNNSGTQVFAATIPGVQALAVDPQGTLIYALTSTGISVALFSQSNPSATTFTALSGTGIAGNWVAGAVDATGRYLVAFDKTANAASTFSITAIGSGVPNGGLTFIHQDPATGKPSFFTFDPQGRYIVAADSTANTITAYSFTPTTTPVLTALTGTAAITLPTTPGGSPGQVAIDPSGQFLFVALSGVASGTTKTAGAVDVYTTNVASGVPAFAEVKGAPFAAGDTTTGLNTLGVGVIDSVQ
jgi:6-phosphogluconolactonase (cycloisomerase 2 family)